jgi:hypothetical protein
LLDALVGCGNLVESVSFRDDLNFAGGGDLERFVEIFAAVLLAAENPDAAHDEIAGMERAIRKNSIWEGPLLDALTGWRPRAPPLTQLSMSCLEPSHGTQGEHEIPVASMT